MATYEPSNDQYEKALLLKEIRATLLSSRLGLKQLWLLEPAFETALDLQIAYEAVRDALERVDAVLDESLDEG